MRACKNYASAYVCMDVLMKICVDFTLRMCIRANYVYEGACIRMYMYIELYDTYVCICMYVCIYVCMTQHRYTARNLHV